MCVRPKIKLSFARRNTVPPGLCKTEGGATKTIAPDCSPNPRAIRIQVSALGKEVEIK